MEMPIINQPNSIAPQELLKSREAQREHLEQQGFVNQTQTGLSSRLSGHLRSLALAERVIVKQKKEWMEVVLGCETQNKYEVMDEQNEVIYTVDEDSEFCMRCWCGPLRPIFVDIRDQNDQSVILLNRPLACQEICFPCCMQKMSISSPPGTVIGSVEQKWGLSPQLLVKDETNSVLFVIKGPFCQFSCRCGDVDFPIYASDGASECGRISKRWRGILHEAFTDADIFGVKFPPGINPLMKALLLGATFLVDYMYFEHSSQ